MLSSDWCGQGTLHAIVPAERQIIFVQIDISGSLDRLWELTQTPELHERWDLRFTSIQYLPRSDPALPQRFLYTTRIGFGLTVRGEGETVGSHDGLAGERISALQFWSEDPKSLIQRGSGYWRYSPFEAGIVRFVTGYDYSVRHGAAGRVFDRLVFRPLLGWATAWSFDRLRLWIEQGICPAVSMQRSLIHGTARSSLAFIWLYQGVVPKLMFRNPDELAMLKAAGLSQAAAKFTCLGMGWAEVAFGLILLLAWQRRWPLWVTLVLMPAATVGVMLSSPGFLVTAFNPVVLNLSVFALAAVALQAAADLPSAKRCVRQAPREQK